jgi:hypothetical protein
MKDIQGGCLCKAIRYRITGKPESSVICHCETCRRASAMPSVAWLTFDRHQVEFLAGTLQTYRSSESVTRGFCGNCGTAISYVTADDPIRIDVTTVSLDDPSTFPPTAEVWMQDKLWWEAYHVALDQFPKGMEDGAYAGD